MRRTLALTLAFGLLFAPLAFSEEAKSPKQRLFELKVELEEKRAALKDLDNQARSLMVAIGELDEALSRLEAEQAAAKAEQRALEEELAKLQAELKEDEARLLQISLRLKKRLRALYVLGEGGTLRAILGAQSFEDLAYRRRLLEKLTDADLRLFAERSRVARDVKARREKLEARLAEAQDTERRIAEQAELMRVTRKEREAAIARIDQEKELKVRAVKEIVAQQRELSRLVKRVSRGPRRGGKGVLREGLSWPVRGTVIRRFGVTREAGTGARLVSNGLHIRAPHGTPVVAAADGRVVFEGWLRGFGRLVIVDHGEGHHTLSAHLSGVVVKKGDEVKRGQTLGFVGDTESLNGTKLYFELREHGRPKDPAPFLR